VHLPSAPDEDRIPLLNRTHRMVLPLSSPREGLGPELGLTLTLSDLNLIPLCLSPPSPLPLTTLSLAARAMQGTGCGSMCIDAPLEACSRHEIYCVKQILNCFVEGFIEDHQARCMRWIFIIEWIWRDRTLVTRHTHTRHTHTHTTHTHTHTHKITRQYRFATDSLSLNRARRLIATSTDILNK